MSTNQITPDDALSTDQLSARTGIPADTLRWWRRRDEGPDWYRLGPKLVRYRWIDVEKWMAEQQSKRAS